MLKKLLPFVLMMVSTQMVGAADHENAIDYPTTASAVSFKSVTELAFTQPTQTISYGDDILQFGLLWQPSAGVKKQPLIVMIHGGCWLNAFGVDHALAAATALAQKGHPVYALEYRRTGDEGGGWPGSFDDIKSALNQINALQQFNVNTGEIILMGHSAGGHLALLAASELSHINFKHVIGLAAITDVSSYAKGENSCQKAAPLFMGGKPEEAAEAYRQASLNTNFLPNTTILLQGDADKIVPISQSELHQIKVKLLNEAGHFDWIHPGTAAFDSLLKLLSDSKNE
ncbi:alpha/beta hydrolase [Marinicella sp. S1101]|uniref:alpha/beta hydrolase n=1 Tax=Marinicella marina TaxID=2996016 RepID=UPI0022609A2E|nr:alpha/beta hydrolase [Marinicella marina]MCX7552732.1 alpha/beta hydrolase [Marinicella marina]MDJ1139959.1 alpha/beta hydrolase [Marinicella marina]